MIQYITQESPRGSRFIYTTLKENIYTLDILKTDVDLFDFNDDFLQENVYELDLTRVTSPEEADQKEISCVKLIKSAKRNVINFVMSNRNPIVYISVDSDNSKNRIIQNFINNENNNDDLSYYSFPVENVTLYFFFNKDKVNSFALLKSISEYIFNEYGMQFVL